MKKTLTILTAAVLLSGCYDDYVKDFDFSGIYTPYQFDLRSFIVGEGMSFEFGPVLAGVISNDRDRDVRYVIDNELLSADLSGFYGSEPFCAMDIFSGNSTTASISNSFVTDAFAGLNLSSLTPLPEDTYSLSPAGNAVIKKGNHSAGVTVKADSTALLSLKDISPDPYYAFAWRITSADADSVLLSRSFEVIAVKYECFLFGNWYHGGRSVVIDDVTQEVIAGTEKEYPTTIPCDENNSGLYSLTTSSYNSVKTNYLGNTKGTVDLTIDKGFIRASSSDGKITDMGSSWNKRALLQDRKIYLNYKYSNGDGTSTVYTDTLTFRNRMRDGVNEWQDPVYEHYEIQ